MVYCGIARNGNWDMDVNMIMTGASMDDGYEMIERIGNELRTGAEDRAVWSMPRPFGGDETRLQQKK